MIIANAICRAYPFPCESGGCLTEVVQPDRILEWASRDEASSCRFGARLIEIAGCIHNAACVAAER